MVLHGVKGKVVVITGASSGIGRATGILLAKEGAKVVLCARRKENLQVLEEDIKKAGFEASYRVVDVTQRDQVQAAVDFAVKEYGKIDVMFNNAGVMPISSIDKLKVDEWEGMIDVNIKGVLYGIAAAVPVMLKQGYGHIINTGSTASHLVFPKGSIYCGTKYFVRAITEGIRKDLGHVIKSTLICPGVTKSELGNDVSDVEAGDYVKQLRRNSLTPETVAKSVLFAIDQDNMTNISDIVVNARPLN